MSFYLQLDGVSNYIKTPSITFNKVVMDFTPYIRANANQTYIDSRSGHSNGYLTRLDNGNDSFGAGISSVTSNGIPIINNSANVLSSTRSELVILMANTRTDDVNIFSNQSNINPMKADVYSVTFFNNEIEVVRYDMSTGTVQDQSGNGRHATLSGGTWADDGEGGGVDPEPQTHTLSLSDSVATNDSISKRLTVIVVDNVNTSETNSENTQKIINDSVVTTDNTTYTQGKAVNLSDSVIILDSVTKSLTRSISDEVGLGDIEDETVLKALIDSISLSDSFSTFGGKSILLTDSINTSDSITTNKQLNKLFNESVIVTDQFEKQATQSIRLFDIIITNESINTFNPNTPELVGTIQLRGKRDLFVYLQGERELFVYLQGERELVVFMKGGLSMIPNQNFNMVSGDTKNLIIDIKENLVGANAKWVLFKPGGLEMTLNKEGNVIDGKINITLDKDDTEELSGIYKHECEVTDQQGNISTVTSGTVVIIKDMI